MIYYLIITSHDSNKIIRNSFFCILEERGLQLNYLAILLYLPVIVIVYYCEISRHS